MKKTQINIKSYLSLLLVAIIWGSGFMGTQMAIDSNMSSSLIMALRFPIATISLWVVFKNKLKNFSKQELICGTIAGLLLFLAFFSQTLGLESTTPSNNAFITATNVIMVPFISWILMKKRPKLIVFIASILSLVGIGVLKYTRYSGIVFNIGDLLTLLCAFLFACHISYVGYGAKKIDTIKLTFLQMVTSAILSLGVLFIFDYDSIGIANFTTGILPAIYLGIFSTCIAFLIQTRVQKIISSSKTAIILSMEAVFGSLFSVIMGYEDFTLNLIIGGSIVIGSILLIEIFQQKKTIKAKK